MRLSHSICTSFTSHWMIFPEDSDALTVYLSLLLSITSWSATKTKLSEQCNFVLHVLPFFLFRICSSFKNGSYWSNGGKSFFPIELSLFSSHNLKTATNGANFSHTFPMKRKPAKFTPEYLLVAEEEALLWCQIKAGWCKKHLSFASVEGGLQRCSCLLKCLVH